MTKDDVIEIIKEWNYYDLPEVLDRKLDVTKFLSWKIKKVITISGFRRSGKTYMLFLTAKKIGKDKTVYINFEDKRLSDIKFKDLLDALREYYGNKNLVLLLDEVQEIEDWGKWLRSLNDLPNYLVVATGSSSKVGLEEIPTELRGRSITLTLFPLDFEEFLAFKGEKLDLPKGIILKYLKEYLEFGGLPEIVLEDNTLKKSLYLKEYFNTFVARDIIERYNILNKKALDFIFKYLLNSTFITYSKIYRTMKSLGYEIGKSTIIEYLNYIEKSYFAYFLPIYGGIKKREQGQKKVYIIDNFFIREFGTNVGVGRLIENLVFLELIRRKSYLLENYEVFYFKTKTNKEIDFLIKEGNRIKQLIQVTYANSFDEIDPREYRSLLDGYELFKEHNPELIIITWDYEDEKELSWFGKNGLIRFIPLWKWLIRY